MLYLNKTFIEVIIMLDILLSGFIGRQGGKSCGKAGLFIFLLLLTVLILLDYFSPAVLSIISPDSFELFGKGILFFIILGGSILFSFFLLMILISILAIFIHYMYRAITH